MDREQGLEPRFVDSESTVLPLDDSRMSFCIRLPVPSRQSALAAGVEPASGSFEDCPSIQLSYASNAPMAGLEPTTCALEARLSVQLRYIGMVQAARVELAPRGLRDRRSAIRATPGWIGDRTRTCILRV